MAEVLAKTETQYHLGVSISFMSLKMLADDASDLFLKHGCLHGQRDVTVSDTGYSRGGSRAAGFGLAVHTPKIFTYAQMMARILRSCC